MMEYFLGCLRFIDGEERREVYRIIKAKDFSHAEQKWVIFTSSYIKRTKEILGDNIRTVITSVEEAI